MVGSEKSGNYERTWHGSKNRNLGLALPREILEVRKVAKATKVCEGPSGNKMTIDGGGVPASRGLLVLR